MMPSDPRTRNSASGRSGHLAGGLFCLGCLALCVIVTACGGAPPAAAPAAPSTAEPMAPETTQDWERAACEASAASLDAVEPADSVHSAFLPLAGSVAGVQVDADSPELAARAKSLVQLSAGLPLSEARVRADVERLWGLGDIEDVQVDSSGPEGAQSIRFVVVSAPVIRSVFRRGEGSPGDELAQFLGLKKGARYSQAALALGLAHANETLAEQGYREARVTVTGRRLHDGGVDLCTHVSMGRKLLLRSVQISGNSQLPTAELAALVQAKPGQPLNDAELERDALVMQAHYYDRGMITTRVSTPEVRVVDDGIEVQITISEGPVFKVASIKVVGDLVTTKTAYLRRLRVKPGDVFSRSKVAADLTSLKALHQEQGAAQVEIEVETNVDPKKKRVDLVLRVGSPAAE